MDFSLHIIYITKSKVIGLEKLQSMNNIRGRKWALEKRNLIFKNKENNIYTQLPCYQTVP